MFLWVDWLVRMVDDCFTAGCLLSTVWLTKHPKLTLFLVGSRFWRCPFPFGLRSTVFVCLVDPNTPHNIVTKDQQGNKHHHYQQEQTAVGSVCCPHDTKRDDTRARVLVTGTIRLYTPPPVTTAVSKCAGRLAMLNSYSTGSSTFRRATIASAAHSAAGDAAK